MGRAWHGLEAGRWSHGLEAGDRAHEGRRTRGPGWMQRVACKRIPLGASSLTPSLLGAHGTQVVGVPRVRLNHPPVRASSVLAGRAKPCGPAAAQLARRLAPLFGGRGGGGHQPWACTVTRACYPIHLPPQRVALKRRNVPPVQRSAGIVAFLLHRKFCGLPRPPCSRQTAISRAAAPRVFRLTQNDPCGREHTPWHTGRT